MERDTRAQVGESLDVRARVYHTENGNVHAEEDTYAVTDRALAETMVAIGFVAPVGWTPDEPPPIEPPPPARIGDR